MAVPQRGHKGAAKPTSLLGGISSTDLAFSVATGGGTGYPDGSDGVFVILVDGVLSGAEKILCSARTGDAFTVATGGRGYDDTVASAHLNNASVAHTNSAVEAAEANAHILATTGVHGIADTSALLTTAAGNAAYAPISLGKIAYGQSTTVQTGISTIPTTVIEQDLTFTAVAGRRYKATVVLHGSQTVATDEFLVSLVQATSTQLQRNLFSNNATDGRPVTMTYTNNSSISGATRWRVVMIRNAGSGAYATEPNSTYPSFLLIEDCGLL